MHQYTTIDDLRHQLSDPLITSVGFVPTMGALHEGHLSIIRQAKAECDRVVVSIFVNPTQFNDRQDFELYPRDVERDADLARSAGCDLLFVPTVEEMYPDGATTTVTVGGPLTEVLEGVFRPGHFAGVATVVTKLLNIVQPTQAYFGEKDWQQLQVIRQMVRDLRMGTVIVPGPTLREPDGLAMSSRNVRLSPEARQQARVIPYLLQTAQDLLDSATIETQTDQGPVIAHWLNTLLLSQVPDAKADYLAVVDPETLQPVDEITDRALVAVAIRIGGVRLIDNRMIVRR